MSEPKVIAAWEYRGYVVFGDDPDTIEMEPWPEGVTVSRLVQPDPVPPSNIQVVGRWVRLNGGS